MCVCVYVWAHSLLCCVVVVEWVRVCECVLLEQTCDRVRANDGAVLCCGGGIELELITVYVCDLALPGISAWLAQV